MGHSEEGHKKLLQESEGTTYFSVYTGHAVQHSIYELGDWTEAAWDQLSAPHLLAV